MKQLWKREEEYKCQLQCFSYTRCTLSIRFWFPYHLIVRTWEGWPSIKICRTNCQKWQLNVCPYEKCDPRPSDEYDIQNAPVLSRAQEILLKSNKIQQCVPTQHRTVTNIKIDDEMNRKQEPQYPMQNLFTSIFETSNQRYAKITINRSW